MGNSIKVNIQENGYAWNGEFRTSYKVDPVEASTIIDKTGARFVSLHIPVYGLEYRSLSAEKAQEILLAKINELSAES